MITEDKFYEKLNIAFLQNIDKDNCHIVKIPNNQRLCSFMKKVGFGDCDETIGVRTAKNLYQLYLENQP